MQKNKVLPKLLVLALLAVILLPSCVKKEIDLNNLQGSYNPSFAAPIVSSSLSVADILNNAATKGTFQINPDNSCYINYSGHLYTVTAQSLIQLPSQSIKQTLTLSNPQITAINGTPINTPFSLPNQSSVYTFNTGTTAPLIDSLVFKSGTLTDTIACSIPANVSCLITIPTAKDANGNIFSKTVTSVYSGSNNVTAVFQYSLAGYHFDMSQGGTTSNQFTVNYSFTITPRGQSIAAPNNTVTIAQNFSNVQFQKFFGYIGQQTLANGVQTADTVALSIFKNSYIINAIKLTNPSVKFYIANSFGVPVQANVPQLSAFTPPSTNLNITGVPNPIPVLSPNLSQVGQVLIDSFSIDNNNSNILTAINTQPQYLLYKLTTLSNPGVVSPVHNNFVLDTSKISLDMSVKIPLVGYSNGAVVLEDTISPFNAGINTTSTGTQIQSVNLHTAFTNTFPVDMTVQVYFTDSLYRPIDSLFSTPFVLPSGTIVSNTFAGAYANSYAVTNPSSSATDILYTNSRVNNLNKARKVLIKGWANTAKSQNAAVPVQFYANNKITVNIGVKAVISVPLHQ